MTYLVIAAVLLAAALVGVVLVRRRTRSFPDELPEEGLTEEEVANLQRKQRASARSVRVRER